MVAAKKANEAPAEESGTPAPAPAPQNLQAERNKVLDKLRGEFREKFDEKKRDVTHLLLVALAHANNPNADEKHNYFKALSEVLKSPVDVDTIVRVTAEYKANPLDIFEYFAAIGEQGTLLQTLMYCLDSDQFADKPEIALNYQQIQKAVRAEDVMRDIVAFFLTRNVSAKKHEGVTVKPEDVMKDLLDTKAAQFDGKELLKARYSGHWKGTLERADKHIQELARTSSANKEKARNLVVVNTEPTYKPYSMTKNKVLDNIDKALQFPQKLNEADTYTLLGIVGHASSADGKNTDAAEAAHLKELLGRLEFKVKKEQFSSSVAQPLTLLMSQVTTPALGKAIYFETLCMMTSNLEITAEEKDMLNTLANTFKLSTADILLMHSRHYLDSGLSGVETSLQAMPVQLKSVHNSLHKYQDILGELALVPLGDIVKTGKEYLEALESTVIPAQAPAEVRVAILSLVGNAMRLDNVFDDGEKQFLQKTMNDLSLTGDDVKAHGNLMKAATVPELCLVVRKWALGQKKTAFLPAVGYYVLRAISADGVIDAQEHKFKTLFFRELDLEASQYVRMLLRVQLDFVN